MARAVPVHPSCSALTGLLTAWVLLLGAAQVSPALHGWMHRVCDHGCGEQEPVTSAEHYCAVVLFSADEPLPLFLPEPIRHTLTELAVLTPERPDQGFLSGPKRARAPPSA